MDDPIFALAEEVGGKVVDLSASEKSIEDLEKIKESLPAEVPMATVVEKRPLRVFWTSNAPWSISGYGNQTRETVGRIRRSGTDIACGNFFGFEGGILPGIAVPGLEDVPQYPKMVNTWGEDIDIYHARDWVSDCVITLQDVWPLDVNLMRQVNHWIPYVPIDHNPVPKIVLEKLRVAYRIVSMSEFGRDELERNGFHSTYIPHMVDTKNMTILDKGECRRMLNIPEDIFLFGIIGANKELPSRKGFEHALQAFVKFHEKHPKSGIYFHVNMMQPGGFNLIEWAGLLGISDCIYHIPPYEQAFKVGRDQMTRIINTFDCLLAPSISEGFGIPIIEAQSCGVPVITTDWTSMSELVEEGKTGFRVKIKERRPSPLGSYFGIPDENEIYGAMESIFANPLDPQYIRQRIIDKYDADMVMETYWKPFIEKLSDELIA